VKAAPIILSLNSGSSSRKFSLYRITDQAEALIAEGETEQIGTRSARMQVRDGKKKILSAKSNFPFGAPNGIRGVFEPHARRIAPSRAARALSPAPVSESATSKNLQSTYCAETASSRRGSSSIGERAAQIISLQSESLRA
jgi:hypothetical protein